MKKILIFGNSASGKTTLAKQFAKHEKLAHLDLDLLAWQATTPPTRKPLAESSESIKDFISQHDNWVIEGCYSDLLVIAQSASSEIIFMNLPIINCIANAKNRAWEPHKYASKVEQDANLAMLIEWISHYESRADTFSKAAHLEFYKQYLGEKKMLTANIECEY